MCTQIIDFLPRMEGPDAPRGFALIGLFLVRMSELCGFYWSRPVTDPTQSFGMTPDRLLSAAADPGPLDDPWQARCALGQRCAGILDQSHAADLPDRQQPA